MQDRLDRYARLVRAHRTLSGVLDAVLRANGEAELLAEAARIAVQDAGYRLAWVGYADAEGYRVRPVACAGFEEGYLERVDIRWDDSPHGRGPTGLALRTARPALAQNLLTDPAFEPWRAEALRRGYASSAAFPLVDGGERFGVLNLYAPEPTAFDRDEVELLERVTAAIAHGVRCARGRRQLSELERAVQHLDRLDLAGRVAATVAHDVNNCLAVVLPCVAAMDAGPLARDAQAAVERAVKLNRELMRLSRRPDLEAPAAIDIDAALERYASVLARAAAFSTLEVALASRPWRARIDPAQLEQVVMNLVVNARDATGGKGRIALRTRQHALTHPLSARYAGAAAGEYVSIEVQDDGAGVAPEIRARLFEPFFTTKGERGTGLGLASVFGIVRQCGGTVVVESVPGAGATFEVLLPRAS